jgi:hypothetical protein
MGFTKSLNTKNLNSLILKCFDLICGPIETKIEYICNFIHLFFIEMAIGLLLQGIECDRLLCVLHILFYDRDLTPE